jgi:hypothetical protein
MQKRILTLKQLDSQLLFLKAQEGGDSESGVGKNPSEGARQDD